MRSLIEELLERFSSEGRPNLKNNISIVWITYKEPNPLAGSGIGASWMPNKQVYPASVVKLIYACAVEVWLQKDLLIDHPELRRALFNMIAHSSNDATSYIIDLLTGTSSGPSLNGQSWEAWKNQRNIINTWLSSLGWSEIKGINCVQKTWADGPYGRDKDFYGSRNQNRNSLSALSVARFLESVMTNDFLPSKRNQRIKDLLKRSLDPLKRKTDPENQIDGFLGEGLPIQTNLWSKAGLMSEARHDAAWFVKPNSLPMLLVVFCEGKLLGKDNFLLPALAYELSKWANKNPPTS